ncbi:MAG TPA: F0F1 ATP synthase subunit B [Kiloniellales bacterium]|nr:F0F1 ATP synthase subunit B [Kiloniellales bacterium]
MSEILSSPETWLALSLIVVVGVLLWKGLAPILAALDRRGDRIGNAIAEAELLREEAEKMLADYKRRQREALGEAEHILEHARREVDSIAEQAARDLEQLIKRREELALAKIAQSEQAAIAAVRAKAVDLAIAASAEVLRHQLDEKSSAAMIERSLGEVAQKLTERKLN